LKFSILHNILIAELSMFDIKITYSSCDSKFPLEFSASTASLLRTSTATPLRSEQSWIGCSTISHWSTPSLCWVVRLNTTFHLAATMAD